MNEQLCLLGSQLQALTPDEAQVVWDLLPVPVRLRIYDGYRLRGERLYGGPEGQLPSFYFTGAPLRRVEEAWAHRDPLGQGKAFY